MILHINPLDFMNYRLIFAFLEKEAPVELNFIKDGLNEETLLWNPHGFTPIFESRDLSIAGGNVIIEYLEDRHPFPPLFPPTPVDRAKSRFIINNLYKEWGGPLNVLMKSDKKKLFGDAKVALANAIIARASESFQNSIEAQDSSEESILSILDCTMLPMIWLAYEKFGIELPEKKARNLLHYYNIKRLHPKFIESIKMIETPELNANITRFES